MAHKRRKRRTQHPSAANANAIATGVNKPTSTSNRSIPKSMVIRMGGSNVGPSVSQLVKDTRSLMEPHTASRLKERRSNRLRDYTTMAGPLGVTHLMLFYRSEKTGNVNFKIGVTPRGPTFTFRVEKYTLCRDVVKGVRRSKGGSAGLDRLMPPLLVMNNFTTATATTTPSSNPSEQQQQQQQQQQQHSIPIPNHLTTLTTSTFQSLFPPISPQTTPLPSIRRVLLINREDTPQNPGAFTLNLRHYAIASRPLLPVSKPLKRLATASEHAKRRNRKLQAPDYSAGADSAPRKQKRTRADKGGLPDMGRMEDVADYFLGREDGGYTSASESEGDATDAAEVEVVQETARRAWNKKERSNRRRAAAEEQQQQQTQQRAPNADAETADADEEVEDSDQEDAAENKPEDEKSYYRGPRMQKRALKLTELGPRMRLRLWKVEEGLCAGKVLWHESVEKSQEEERELDGKWEERGRMAEERRKRQRENVERKRMEKGKKQKKGKGAEEGAGEDGPEEDEEWDDVVDGDVDGMEVNGDDVEEEEEEEEEA